MEQTNLELLSKAINSGHHNKVTKLLKEPVSRKDGSVLKILKDAINNHDNGIILNESTKAYYRISRKDLHDCAPLFELWDVKQMTILEALLEVLGYDRMVPTLKEQELIIQKFFFLGKGLDKRYYTDPRYGLAAACAGWDIETVRPFLAQCMESDDAPLKYVAEKSLKQKYVRLR